MYISAFLHRDELFEITNRWICDRLETEDPLRITRILTYDGFIAWEKMLDFTDSLNRAIHGSPLLIKPVSTKRDLKDFICATSQPRTPRIDHLISTYQAFPEYHYVGSPMAGYIYHDDQNRIVSLCRFKRIKRIAEKASRYAAMHIRKKMEMIAEQIGRQSGAWPFPDAIPNAILIQAERDLMLSIKTHGFSLPVDIMAIKDVLGIKIIQETRSEAVFESVIASLPGVAILEKEFHSGNYNATHYLLELEVDLKEMCTRFRAKARKTTCTYRGLCESGIFQDFESFVETDKNTLQIDLILTTFEDFVESEIGRSMHEARIFTQRTSQNHLGNIPINIEYIIEYLMAVGLSPTVHIDSLPIKTWGRYLPDALSHQIRNLYHIPSYSIISL